MLKDSGLLEDLERNAFRPVTSQAMCIYGDPAYPLQFHQQQRFREAPLTAPMEQFNKSMSSVRTSVEWIFGHIVASLKFLYLKKNLKSSCVVGVWIFSGSIKKSYEDWRWIDGVYNGTSLRETLLWSRKVQPSSLTRQKEGAAVVVTLNRKKTAKILHRYVMYGDIYCTEIYISP